MGFEIFIYFLRWVTKLIGKICDLPPAHPINPSSYFMTTSTSLNRLNISAWHNLPRVSYVLYVTIWRQNGIVPRYRSPTPNPSLLTLTLASVTQTVFRSPETKHSLRTRERILFQWRNAFRYKRPMKFLVFKQPHTVCLFCVDISWA